MSQSDALSVLQIVCFRWILFTVIKPLWHWPCLPDKLLVAASSEAPVPGSQSCCRKAECPQWRPPQWSRWRYGWCAAGSPERIPGSSQDWRQRTPGGRRINNLTRVFGNTKPTSKEYQTYFPGCLWHAIFKPLQKCKICKITSHCDVACRLLADCSYFQHIYLTYWEMRISYLVKKCMAIFVFENFSKYCRAFILL